MITTEWLRKHFDYDPDGFLVLKEYWNERVHLRRRIGEKMVAGYEKSRSRADRYERIVINGVYFLVHHLIWVWHYGYMPEDMVMDHKDMNKLNNRIENLRWTTYHGNSAYERSVKTKEKLRFNNLGKPCTEEAKEKLRLANLGKKLSEETKERMRWTKQTCYVCGAGE